MPGQADIGAEEEVRGYVYLIGPLDGCWKIGHSFNPDTRLSQLGWLPCEIGVRARIATTCRTWLERYLHQAFRHRHVRGEWFALSQEDVSLVASISVADSAAALPPTILIHHEQNEPPPVTRAPIVGKSGRGRGRPKSRPEELLRLRCDVTPEEHADVTAAAESVGESVSAFARRTVVDAARRRGRPRKPAGGGSP